MYTLKSMAINAKLYSDSTAPHFSQTFVGMVETYGRSFEFGLASRHYLQAFPIAPARHDADGPWHDHKRTHGDHAEKDQAHGPIEKILDRAKELELTS